MKLRTKFVLLISGTFIIPIVLTLALGFFYSAFSVNPNEIARVISIGHWLRQFYPRNTNPASPNISIPSSPPPPGLDMVLIDGRGTALYSTISSIETASTYAPEKVIGMILSARGRSLVMSESVLGETGGGKYTAIVGIDSATLNILLPNKENIFFPFFFIFLIVTTAVFGVVVMSRLGRSIIRLESATKQIVDGDLDFRLHARGNDEIASLTRSFDAMRERLKEEFEKRSRFLMAVSHDLATPLTSIEGYVEALLDGYATDDASRDRYLGIILDKSKVLDSRISELIEFVRMETGEWKMRCAPVDLKEFLSQVAAIFKEDAFVLKRSFTSALAIADGVTVLMDRNLIVRALENLFHNAVRYSNENDSISFRSEIIESEAKREIALTIEDTGIGIPEDEIAHIFDPFFRGKSFTKERGFGLGLSTVRSIIEAHGWSITVSSEAGIGSVFGISIPMSSARK